MAKINMDPSTFNAWISDAPTRLFMNFLETEEFIRRQAMGEGHLAPDKYLKFSVEADVYKAIRQEMVYEDLVPGEEEDNEEISSDWKADTSGDEAG